MQKQELKAGKPFDAYIGSAAATSWWELGKWLSRRDDPRSLALWRTRMIDDVGPGTVEAKAINPDRLREFAEDVYSLLERKYRGESIGRNIQDRVRAAASYVIHDEGDYLAWHEPDKVFWANEYRLLFMELREDTEGDPEQHGWREAVGRCAECNEFFVKARRDQLFHSTKCRTKAGNRVAYDRKRHGRRAR